MSLRGSSKLTDRFTLNGKNETYINFQSKKIGPQLADEVVVNTAYNFPP